LSACSCGGNVLSRTGLHFCPSSERKSKWEGKAKLGYYTGKARVGLKISLSLSLSLSVVLSALESLRRGGNSEGFV